VKRKPLGEVVTPLAEKICPRLYKKWLEASSESRKYDKTLKELKEEVESEAWEKGNLPVEAYAEAQKKANLVMQVDRTVTNTFMDVLSAVVPYLLKENRKLKRELAELKTAAGREARNAS
jgi:cell division septum initiation protein DivIVA